MQQFPFMFANPELRFLGMALFLVVIAWSVIWKGFALWKAARAGSKEWFVALLIINTLGILEILYLYIFSKRAKASVDAQ